MSRDVMLMFAEPDAEADSKPDVQSCERCGRPAETFALLGIATLRDKGLQPENMVRLCVPCLSTKLQSWFSVVSFLEHGGRLEDVGTRLP